jgi:deoxyadenosine/deoxycytidine kinase
MMKRCIYAIEGNISSGKSTLVQNLTKYSDLKLNYVLEPLHEWNELNILKNFYEKKERWSFTFENYVQLCRLRSHFSTLSDNLKDPAANVTLIERSLWSSFNVFAVNSYEEKRLSPIEFGILKNYFNFFSNNLLVSDACGKKRLPFKIIYLRTKPEVCYERLKIRNREAEATVSLDYLKNVHDKHEQWIHEVEKSNLTKVYVLNGDVSENGLLQQICDIGLFNDIYIQRTLN